VADPAREAAPAGAAALPAPETAGLVRECRAFARYLAGVEPDAYLEARYVAFHIKVGAAVQDPVDRALLAVASVGGVATAVADAYAGRFRRRSALRRKLIALLALLESSSPAFERIDAPYRGGALRVYAKLVARALGEVAALAVGLLLFGPLQLLARRRAGSA
jgi:hypothetical protein